jgi:hypothetical protein
MHMLHVARPIDVSASLGLRLSLQDIILLHFTAARCPCHQLCWVSSERFFTTGTGTQF